MSALIVIHGRRQIGTNAVAAPAPARRRHGRASGAGGPAARRQPVDRGERHRRRRARRSRAARGRRRRARRRPRGGSPPRRPRPGRAPGRRSRPVRVLGPADVAQRGCSQNRVHATTSTPSASSVSVADGTRLTTRTARVTRARASSSGASGPRTPRASACPGRSRPSSFSSWRGDVGRRRRPGRAADTSGPR